MGAEKLTKLRSPVNLLICQKTKIDDWFNHFKNYYPQLETFNLRNDKELEIFILSENYRIGIINYELTFRRKQLHQLKNFTLMLDESSLIQNEKTKRSKFILKLNPDNIILLSGTPTAGKYEKLLTQIHLLGWNIREKLFWNHYVDWEWDETEDGFFRKKVNGYKNVDRLKKKLADHGAVFLKSEEVIDLPEQIFTKVMVPVSKEYKKFMRSRIITIEDRELVGDTPLTKRLYARMLCGHYNKNKLEAFRDLVDSTDDRLIVFYNFNDELDVLMKLVEDKPMSIINGSIKDLTAYEEQDNSITFVQYQAGAMGLNLQKANKVIYFTLPQSSELFEQSNKRIHRIGQTQRCFYYYLMCSGSVEEDILKNLELRRDYTDALFHKYDS